MKTITQKELYEAANKIPLIRIGGKGFKIGCFVTTENINKLSLAISQNLIMVDGMDKVTCTKDNEFFYNGKLRIGLAIMWGGDGYIYLNPKFDEQALLVTPETFTIPNDKTKGFRGEGKKILEEAGLKKYSVLVKIEEFPISLLTKEEVIVEAPVAWGANITQVAQVGAWVNIISDWETGLITEIYIKNPDPDGSGNPYCITKS